MRMHLVPQISLVEARGSQRGPGIAMRIHAHIYSPAGDIAFCKCHHCRDKLHVLAHSSHDQCAVRQLWPEPLSIYRTNWPGRTASTLS